MDIRNIAHYRLLEKIGEGGMGAVYKAEDTRLGRVVALKFIRPESLDAQGARLRFTREARAIAALDHPNICTIFEIGEDGDLTYLSMSFVDGPSLATLLQSGPLPVQRAIEMAAQIADGLSEAHQKGIVHRDIKPANILLTGKGTVKIVDFGLAGLCGDVRLTLRGTAVGTPVYMAPEQWMSVDPDPRSDVWALGVVLYEMLSGRLPFAGVDGRTLSHSILYEPPHSLTGLRKEIPVEVERIVSQMLAKEPERRTPSAEHAAALLRSWKRQDYSAGGALDRTATMISVPAVVRAPEIASVAVLPFVNNGSDPENEYFADGITDELIAGLAKVGALRVVSRASAFRFKGSNLTLSEIGAQLGVKYLLTGSLRRFGDRLRMTAELILAEDGYQLWSEVYQREARDVFAIQEELADSILATLKIRLSTANPLAMRDRPTPELPAYQHYLKGLFYWNKRTQPAMLRAIEFFQEAIDADPLYPQPYCGLADALMISGLFGWDTPNRTMRRAKQAALRALEINPNQGEAMVSLAMIQFLYEWDTAASEASFRAGLRAGPHYAIGRAFHAHFLLWTGESQAAMKEIDEAMELDPLSMNIVTNRGWFLIYQRRYEEAAATLTRALELEPNYVRANLYLGMALAKLGRIPEAIASTQKAVASSTEDPMLLVWLAHVFALAGMEDDARSLLRRVDERTDSSCVSPLDLALPYGALKQFDRALDLMDQAIEERWPLPVFLRDPRLDPFRDQPRFLESLRRAGLVNPTVG